MIEKVLVFRKLNEMVIFYSNGRIDKMSILPDLISFCKQKGIKVIEY